MKKAPKQQIGTDLEKLSEKTITPVLRDKKLSQQEQKYARMTETAQSERNSSSTDLQDIQLDDAMMTNETTYNQHLYPNLYDITTSNNANKNATALLKLTQETEAKPSPTQKQARSKICIVM